MDKIIGGINLLLGEITMMKAINGPIDFTSHVLYDNEDGGCQRGHGGTRVRFTLDAGRLLAKPEEIPKHLNAAQDKEVHLGLVDEFISGAISMETSASSASLISTVPSQPERQHTFQSLQR